jgi:hypothetical protein
MLTGVTHQAYESCAMPGYPPCLWICIHTQAMFLMALQLSKLYEAGSMSHEQASLVKSWNTLRGRVSADVDNGC